MAARPKSIVYFECAYFLAIAVNLLSVYLTWDRTIAEIEATPGYAGRGALYLIWTLLFWMPINLSLWYFAALRHSAAARWMIVALAVVNLFDLGTLALFGGLTQDLFGLLNLAFYISSFVAAWFLFQPDAKLWFEGRSGEGYPDIFS